MWDVKFDINIVNGLSFILAVFVSDLILGQRNHEKYFQRNSRCSTQQEYDARLDLCENLLKISNI